MYTPIGSRFSIEQMMMQLSALSRTTSISYSFQPRTDFDQNFGRRRRIQTALDDFEELLTVIGNAAASAAEREAWVMMAGRPTTSSACAALQARASCNVALRSTSPSCHSVSALVERLVEIVTSKTALFGLGALGFVALAVSSLISVALARSGFRGIEANLFHGFVEKRAIFCSSMVSALAPIISTL